MSGQIMHVNTRVPNIDIHGKKLKEKYKSYYKDIENFDQKACDFWQDSE